MHAPWSLTHLTPSLARSRPSSLAQLRTAAGVAADTLVAVNDFEGEENQVRGHV